MFGRSRTLSLAVATAMLAVNLPVSAILASDREAAAGFEASAVSVSVTDHGARGDGLTDDTAAFQRAVAAAGAGGVVYVPAGEYLLGRVDVPYTMTVRGAGAGATLLRMRPANNDVLLHITADRVAVADLAIDGDLAKQTGGYPHGIQFDGATDGLVERVRVDDCEKSGVVAWDGADRLTVRDSEFHGNENDVEFHRSAYCTATANVCYDTETEALTSYEEAGGPGTTHHNSFVGNTVYGALTGVNLERTHDDLASGNRIEGTVWGVQVQCRNTTTQDSYGNTVTGNTLVGTDRSTSFGIFVDAPSHGDEVLDNEVSGWRGSPLAIHADDVRASGNTVDSARSAVELDGDGVSFEGNTVTNSAADGMLVYGPAAGLRVQGNRIEGSLGDGIVVPTGLTRAAFEGNVIRSNGRGGTGAGIWASAVWTESAFFANTVDDPAATRTQTTGVRFVAGSPMAAGANTVTGSAAWPAATLGAAVTVGLPAVAGASAWKCTEAGSPGTWAPATTAPAPAPAPAPSGDEAPKGRTIDVSRLAGADRYQTAVEASRRNYASANSVIVATGADYADALSAAGLAGALDAPVLLTRPDVLPEPVADEISRLGAKSAVIVGGTRAVSDAVAAMLGKHGVKAERIAGANRYDTAARIAARTEALNGAGCDTVFVARGDSFADALSASAAAYGRRFPILLVRPTAMPAETAAALKSLAPAKAVVLGSEGAVSSQVERVVDGYAGSVDRVAGATRYATSAAIARYAVRQGWTGTDVIGLAAGTRFADALSAGPACGNGGGVLLLTPTEALASEAESFLGEHGTSVRLFGGNAALASGMEQQVIAALR